MTGLFYLDAYTETRGKDDNGLLLIVMKDHCMWELKNC